MSSECIISIGGDTNHIVDKFDTTASDRNLQIHNDHSTGSIVLQLGSTDTNTKFEIQNSNGDVLYDILGTGLSLVGGYIPSGNLSTLQSIASPAIDQKFRLLQSDGSFHYDKLCYYTGRTWQVEGETIEVRSSTSLSLYQIVKVDTSTNYKVTVTTTPQDINVLGVVVINSPSGADEYITLAVRGVWPVGMIVDTYSRQGHIRSSSTAGWASTPNANTGNFGFVLKETIVLSIGTPVICFIHAAEKF